MATMDFSTLVNYALYAISGLCFGIFASRYSIFAAAKLTQLYHSEGITGLFSGLPQILFLFVTFFLFPTWFIAKTPIGGFVYYALIIYFFNRGYRTHIKKGE